jgi:hypothetical protein
MDGTAPKYKRQPYPLHIDKPPRPYTITSVENRAVVYLLITAVGLVYQRRRTTYRGLSVNLIVKRREPNPAVSIFLTYGRFLHEEPPSL